MRLKWIKQEDAMNTYRAESARFRFIIVAPPGTKAALWVQPVTSDWATNPIAERMCRSKLGAQRFAQSFENKSNPRRL